MSEDEKRNADNSQHDEGWHREASTWNGTHENE